MTVGRLQTIVNSSTRSFSANDYELRRNNSLRLDELLWKPRHSIVDTIEKKIPLNISIRTKKGFLRRELYRISNTLIVIYHLSKLESFFFTLRHDQTVQSWTETHEILLNIVKLAARYFRNRFDARWIPITVELHLSERNFN